MRLHGKNAKIVIDGVLFTTGTQWDLRASREYADVSVFGDDGKVYAAGLKGVDISFQGLIDGGIFGAAAEGLVTVALYSDASTLIASGKGYVDVGGSASVSDAVRVSGTVKGSGAWALA